MAPSSNASQLAAAVSVSDQLASLIAQLQALIAQIKSLTGN
jgi:hypothetical protein